MTRDLYSLQPGTSSFNALNTSLLIVYPYEYYWVFWLILFWEINYEFDFSFYFLDEYYFKLVSSSYDPYDPVVSYYYLVFLFGFSHCYAYESSYESYDVLKTCKVTRIIYSFFSSGLFLRISSQHYYWPISNATR